MRNITLLNIYHHPITQKYLKRSGMAHAISVAYHAFYLSLKHKVNPDIATKAGLLHDIGHYTWYSNGEWDYQKYRNNDIHTIKGAERAHKLLIRLGEDPKIAKEVAIAVLFHSDSFLPEGQINLTPLQEVVALADNNDKQPDDFHHYREIDHQKEIRLIMQLDHKVEDSLVSFKKQYG